MDSASSDSDPRFRLERAFRQLLGEDFESEFRALLDGMSVEASELESSELFLAWVSSHLYSGSDPAWIFGPLRPSERRRLTDALGIPRPSLVGRDARELARLVLQAVNLPCLSTGSGASAVIRDWERISELAKNGDDERAALQARSRAERILRQQLIFWAESGHSTALLDVLRDPGSLRLPNFLAKFVQSDTPSATIGEQFKKDGWADLGFLTLLFRKFAVHLEREDVRTPRGSALQLCSQREHEALIELATALQPYAHDRPSALSTRVSALIAALESIQFVLGSMRNRGVLPTEAIVLERVQSWAGAGFRTIDDSGLLRTLRANATPDIGDKVLVLDSAPVNLASCIWTYVPWP